MNADQRALRLQHAKTRLAEASTYIPGCESWLAVREAVGCWVYDITGSRFLDFGEGGRVALLGHGFPLVQSVVFDQVQHGTYPGSPMDTAAQYSVQYAKALSGFFPAVDEQPQQVLVCSSISEARLVMRQLAPDALEIRPISPGGALDGGLVQDLVHQARSAGQLVVADETMTGFGRTGTFLASEQFNFVPDMVLLGPPGAGGLPFAALVAPARVFERVEDFGPVFISPVSCAAAFGVLSGITPELMAHVAEMGKVLDRAFSELAKQFPHHIIGTTGVGLLRQLTLVDPTRAEKLWKGCRDQGLIVGADLTLTPPLVVSEDEVVVAADVVADVLLEWDTSS